ncbi:MAG: prepilin-type N-terminal cleavage/methylation domain-containing protein [Candidatus Liptonbacteria bacterium]
MHKGFTIIEFVVTAALIAIVAGISLIALNPVGQLASARNSERSAHVNALVMAIRANLADSRTGIFSCAAGDLPTSTAKRMASGGASGTYNIAPCLVPIYTTALPYDPLAPGAHYASNDDYDTGYMVMKNASTGQVTVSAPYAESGKVISIIR